jgi:hypothetical protein
MDTTTPAPDRQPKLPPDPERPDSPAGGDEGEPIAYPVNLLGRGNGKLGENIHHWSLPAVDACPGRSPLCQRHCYARTGRFRTRRLQDLLRRNLALSRQPDFAARMAREVNRRWCRVVRVHVAGDYVRSVGRQPARWQGISRRAERRRP